MKGDGQHDPSASSGHSFNALQSRINRSKALAVRLASQGCPATYLVFVVLRVNGVDLTATGQRLPLEMRKALLARLLEPSDRCRAVEYREGGGIDFFQECILAGLEGAMAKDRSGLYHPVKRDAAWLNIEGVQEDSFLVCGYTEGEGWR